ncbi:Uncharacterized protein APZ42_024187 [Daphnia magna]|uniref:Secreted protein n=1 Tax=Daphnia magna TaxID=35525 RepID=A0A164UI45_9CRUS|nr:Uncharacterized protein APZ42_024187 [Daphnia magna]
MFFFFLFLGAHIIATDASEGKRRVMINLVQCDALFFFSFPIFPSKSCFLVCFFP